MDQSVAFRRALGRTIRELRAEAGLTQRELAAVLHRSQQSVSLIERGIRAPRELRDVAEAFGISLGVLMKRIDGPGDG